MKANKHLGNRVRQLGTRTGTVQLIVLNVSEEQRDRSSVDAHAHCGRAIPGQNESPPGARRSPEVCILATAGSILI